MKQLVLPLETRSALGREDFIVADGNRGAVAFIDSFPGWTVPAAALHGAPGSGKSHLAGIWAGRARARVVEASGVDASLLHDSPDALAIENVDSVPPDAQRDAILFALMERGRPLLLTGCEPPPAWPALLPDLISRYRALPSFAMWAPDDALLQALARKLFADRQIAVPDAVIAQMIRSLERSPGAMRDFVAQLDARSLTEKRPVTVAMLRELLAR